MDSATGVRHAEGMEPTPARTPRQLAHQEMERRILAAARTQLTEVGPAQLSLRGVARELGVASSAVYRYVKSREDLLTRLIVQSFDELAEAAEQATAAAGADPTQRWTAWAMTMRDWARAHPYDWALIYGTPIPGYAAPPDTIEPATRVTTPVLQLVRAVDRDLGPTDADARAALAPLVGIVGAQGGAAQIEPSAAYAMMAAWSAVHGFINLELGGHFVGVLADPAPVYATLVRRTAEDLGLSSGPAAGS